MQQSINPYIEWKEICNKKFLYFTFSGTLTYEAAKSAIAHWNNMICDEQDCSVPLIWQCLDMKGYEPLARSVWQKAIKELKDQIDSIWLVTDSAIIAGGARIIALFTSYDIKVVKSLQELETSITRQSAKN